LFYLRWKYGCGRNYFSALFAEAASAKTETKRLFPEHALDAVESEQLSRQTLCSWRSLICNDHAMKFNGHALNRLQFATQKSLFALEIILFKLFMWQSHFCEFIFCRDIIK
jgi:hypothetical protein